MSLPSKAVFMKNGEIVSEPFINCGWFHEGMITTIKIIEKLYKSGDILEKDTYDSVKIYNVVLSRKEVDYIIKRMIDKDWYHYIPKKQFNKIKIPMIKIFYPKLIVDDIVSVQPLQSDIFKKDKE